MNLSLVWLRRDLRLHDHAALSAALEAPHPVQPVFVFDTDILARFSNPTDRRLTFLAHTLCEMNRELARRGGALWVFHGKATDILPQLATALAARVVAARDFEPGTQTRDAAVAAQVSLMLVKDHLVFSPEEILKSGGTPFKVFTPYSKAWLARLSPADYGSYSIDDAGRYATIAPPEGLRLLPLDTPDALLSQLGYQSADISPWPVLGAGERFKKFVQAQVADYKSTRDLMGMDGTSRMSPYLRFGLVSIRELVRQCVEQGQAATYINELIWREFYAMILYHYPESTQQEWNPKYRGLAWSQDAAALAAWQAGRTGFPVVDAAMRQLLATGWMHNRARMIVASFLTKDLQLDWRLGEEHFAQHLMDYELASNVGGWQWSASTGTDAQPWFRIFNPYLQSKKFDPDGEYIRRYVPELAHITGDAIHDPSPIERGGYPLPMVDHATAREKTLAMFRGL